MNDAIIFDHKKGHTLTLKHTCLYYETYGNADLPAVIFLHGGFGQMETLNPLATYFSKNYFLVGIDSRGHGRSTLEPNGKLTYADMVEDVRAVIAVLGIKKYAVVGFSDGGVVALKLAILEEQATNFLITVGADWSSKSLLHNQTIYTRISGESWRNKFPEDYRRYQALNPKPDFNQLATAIVSLWQDESSTGYPNQQVTSIRCPVLALRGENDLLLSKELFLELGQLNSNITLCELASAGHMAFTEKPEACQQKIVTFLREL